MFPNVSLSTIGLDPSCKAALYQTVNCADQTASLMTDGYIGSFNNDTITAQVCSAGCEASIAKLHQTIDSTCGSSASLVPGLPFLDMLDLLWGNWNQSCFVNPTTGKNCNDIIAAFPEVEDLADLLEPNLCSYCNVQKLALMQADAYNDEYDKDWQSSYAASLCM
ncbi:uncharacterized protein BDV14DRAFT_202405 [Aspergillus stella-maris]|uniref:uncharacterized protein n=1 Tax=Aspergillus stella-maris TaxID=1810926 RepID=UPI003CCCBD04